MTFATTEPLASKPTVSFKQPGRTAVTVTATRRADGTYQASFTVRGGGPGPATLRISAKDRGGQLNRTTLPIRVVS